MATASLTICRIGKDLDEECHKLSHSRKTGLIDVGVINKSDRDLIQRRSGVIFTEKDQLCLHHEKQYLSRYEDLQTFCCDPFSLHKNRITRKFK